MLKVEIRLFATLREGRKKRQVVELEDGARIKDLLKLVEIDEGEVSILLQNGRHGPATRKLRDGDIIAVFPPVGGG